MTQHVLVIVPCGKSKISGRRPDQGPTQAAEAYTGGLFKLNQKYAERFGDRWVVLSAKYGFVDPEFEIPGPFEVSFKRKKSQPIDAGSLRQQVNELDIHLFSMAVGLGGAD